jgi:hypothetical protein
MSTFNNESRRLGGVSAVQWRCTVVFMVVGAALALALQAVLVHGMTLSGEGNVGVLNRVMRGGLDAEILISGSSRAMYHYDPRVIEHITGLSVYNIGRNGTKLHEQLALLRLYVERNTAPRYLIQNVDVVSLRENDDITDPKQYVAWLRNEEIYRPLVARRQYYIVYRWVPLFALARTGGMRTAIEGLVTRSVTKPDELKGYSPQLLTWNEDFEKFKQQNPEGLNWSIDPGQLRVLADLLELCRQHEIEAVLVLSPDYRETQHFFRTRQQTISAFKAVAEKGGVTFWDYSDEPMCDDRTYFYNSQHLNHAGAAVFSDSIGRRLSKHKGQGREAEADVLGLL